MSPTTNSNTDDRRMQFLPLLAEVFSRHGYRRATIALLAEACDVRENILYRVWKDKKAMFLDAIDYVFASTAAEWREIIATLPHPASEPVSGSDSRSTSASDNITTSFYETAAERVLDYESKYREREKLYRIVFAGLSETDDPEVRDALRHMYERYARMIRKHLQEHFEQKGASPPIDLDAAAWGFVSLGVMADLTIELGSLDTDTRRAIIQSLGNLMLGKVSRLGSNSSTRADAGPAAGSTQNRQKINRPKTS